MTNLAQYNGTQNQGLGTFDLLFRNFFDKQSDFRSVTGGDRFKYPVDVRQTENSLIIDIAAISIDKKDVEIRIEAGDTLKVKYNKEVTEEDSTYVYKGIANRAFDLGWKISPLYDLSKIDASMENGLLTIEIPKAKEQLQKVIEIK